MAKEIGNLNVVVGLDATGFQNGIGNLNREMKKVQSEFRLASTEMGKGGKSLDSLKLKSDSLTKQVELQRQKVAALSSAHQNSVETKGEDAKATQELEIKLNKAKTQLSSMEQNLKRTNQEIELQSSSFYNLGKTLEPVGKKFQDVGKKMESVGKGLSKKITVPLTAIGAASTKLGVDFEAAMSEVGAISGATAEEIEVLEAAAREAGATTNKSATESAEALKYMALAGWDVETSQRALMPMVKLSSAGNMELGRTADLVTDGMSAMNLKIDDLDDYLNILTQTANNANTDIDQLGEAFVVVGGRLSLLEVETSEAATALGILGDNGIKGSEAGRGLNAILTNLTAPTGRAKVALDELGVSAFDTSGEFIGIEETLKLVETSMDGMTQEQQNMYMSMIAGKEHSKTFNALMSSLGGGFDDLKGKVEDSDGALEQMYGTMTDNTKGSIDNLKSALEELGLTIYDNLKPSIDWLVGILQSITDKMNSLSPETQQMIVRIGMVAAALGPLLIIGGKVVSGAGAIISAFSKASIALAGLKTGAATATTATGGLASGFSVAGVAAKAGALLLNPWVLGIGAATVAGVALYKHLSEDSIPAIDLFGDEVSESTKQAVGGFLELNEEATLALNQLSWSGQEVTQEMADGITNNFSQMSAQILEELDTQHEESLGKIQNFVTNSTSLSQEEQDGILNNMQTGYENRKQAISDGEARIKEILDTASTEKRALTKEEQEEINSIQQEMVDTGIQVLSENEVEAKAIMERMKAQAGEITALQAAEVVRNSLEQKDGAIQAAEEQYNDVIKEIIRQRDEAGTISEDQADKLIEEAKRQRDETVDRAEEMHEDVVKEAKEQAKEHVNQVDRKSVV